MPQLYNSSAQQYNYIDLYFQGDNFPNCGCFFCKECMQNFLKDAVETKEISQIIKCPGCSQPNIEELDEDKLNEYFTSINKMVCLSSYSCIQLLLCGSLIFCVLCIFWCLFVYKVGIVEQKKSYYYIKLIMIIVQCLI